MVTTLGRTLLILAATAIIAGAYFAWLTRRHEMDRLDTSEGLRLMERLMVANRDLELLDWQPRGELIRTKHLASGREILFTYTDVRRGRTAVGFEEHPVEQHPDPGAPDWLPVYPGAQVVSSQRAGLGGEVLVAVALPHAKLQAYYQRAMRAEGMNVVVERLGENESWVRAYSFDGQRRLHAKLIGRREGTSARLEYVGK